jgi:hypothetical protein
MATEWTEESVNLCLQLFVSLLPLNHKLLKELRQHILHCFVYNIHLYN